MSTFRFFCPTCKQRMSCDEGDRGRLIDCPTCSSNLLVPGGRKSVVAEPQDNRDFHLLAEADPDLEPSGAEFELQTSARVQNRLSRVWRGVCLLIGTVLPIAAVVLVLAPPSRPALRTLLGRSHRSEATPARAPRVERNGARTGSAPPARPAAPEFSIQHWNAQPGNPVTIYADPSKVNRFNVVLTNGQQVVLFPCPADRWNTSPGRYEDADFRGHVREKERTSMGRPHLELSYRIGDSPISPVQMEQVVSGPGKLYLFSSDQVDTNGNPEDNTGFIRVKILTPR